MTRLFTTHIDLQQKVASLKKPSCYPSRPQNVEAIETHMAWVFLTDQFAYKLKKPVRFDFLDFSTLESRRRNGRDEVRLNRRLAGDVYIGLVPLSLTESGTLLAEESGQVADWLVKMRRLPSNRMLDYQLLHNSVTKNELQPVANKLVHFYQNATPEEFSPAGYLERYKSDIQGNADALRHHAYQLPQTLVENVINQQTTFLDHSAELLKQRASSHKIIEAHGDLRPEHICLLPTPVIFDCLEFNRAFRLLDPLDELAFLSMECDYLDAPFVERVMLDTLEVRTAEKLPSQLIRFYKSYRAALRAKLAVWHLNDDPARKPQKWVAKATRYLELALTYHPNQE